jgi:tRNA dimethylallyltransferase
MLLDSFPDALVLTGPTASGKSALGIEIAKRLSAEIISMDSMAIYRGMDIGTAKPSPEQRMRVSHHLIDVLDPWESGSVAWWLKNAKITANRITSRGKRVLFVGGTPLYLKALLYGLFEGPAAEPDLRRRLAEEAHARGQAWLFDRLQQVDPTTARRVHVNDLKRIIRALEVWELTGTPISSWQREWITQAEAQYTEKGVEIRILWLDLPREELYARIDRRVERMFAAGFVDEVRALLAMPRPLSREASYALGYKEIMDHLNGKLSLEDTVLCIQKRSRHFAKRQITWFRHLPRCRPITRELTFPAWGLKMEL